MADKPASEGTSGGENWGTGRQSTSRQNIPWTTIAGAAALGAYTFSPAGSPMTDHRTPGAQSSATGIHYVDERILDARLATAEAKTDTKFAQLLGEMKLIGEKVSTLSTSFAEEIKEVKKATATVKWNILGASIALGALILGLFAYGAQMFDLATALFQAG